MSEDRPPNRRGNPAWKKGGASPNPKGRPRTGMALAERIREKVDMNELVDIAMTIVRGEPMVRMLDPETGLPFLAKEPRRPGAAASAGPAEPVLVDPALHAGRPFEVVWPTTAERLKALEWIRDSGGLKPPAEVKMSVAPAQDQDFDPTMLTGEQLDQYLALCDAVAAAQAMKQLEAGDDE